MTQTHIDKKIATEPLVFTKTTRLNPKTFIPEIVFSFNLKLEAMVDDETLGESQEDAIEKVAEHVKQQFLAFVK
jgi:hypothetical protein